MAATRWVQLSVLGALFFAIQCGGERAGVPIAPTTPSSAAPGLGLTVQVGVTGNAPASLVPGETRQLWATARYSNEKTADVTNLAVWRSSNPVVATVQDGGLMTAAADGLVDLTATYQNISGALHAEVRQAACEASTMTPPSLTFSAFGYSACNNGYDEPCGQLVTVSTARNECRWVARSDVPWLFFSSYGPDRSTYDPLRSGDGLFFYLVQPNNFPSARTGHIILSFTSGAQIVHTVTEEQPRSCSYVVTPETSNFIATGGAGSFTVATMPGNCRWTATSVEDYFGVQIISGASGTGAGTVKYRVAPRFSFAVDAHIVVAGLSGANPPAQHTIHIAAR